MPLILQTKCDKDAHIGVWKITETEDFLIQHVDAKIIENVSTFKSQKRRLEFLASRILLKALGISPHVHYNENGKPFIENGFISLTHSGKWAACIYHPSIPCSIDMEVVSDKLASGGKYFFNENEILAANKQAKSLTLLWVCKECAYKMADDTSIDFKKHLHVILDIESEKQPVVMKTFKKKLHYSVQYALIENALLGWIVGDDSTAF